MEQIRKARALGFEGIAIETKRPVASPLDLSAGDRQAIKAAAAAEGIEICAIESLSNFASPLMEERENNLAMMRLVIDLAADLDVNLVKVFAAWPGVVNDEDETAFYAPYEKGNYYRSLYPSDLRAGGGRWKDCARRRTTPRSVASRWPCRITRPCCGPATRTRWR